MAEFKYQEPFPTTKDDTVYRKLTSDYVTVQEIDGRKILKVAPEGLQLLAKEAMIEISFFLRSSHLQKLAKILEDPEASDNDRFVAYNLLQNAVIAVRIPARLW